MEDLQLKGIELFLSKIFNSQLVVKIEEFKERYKKLKEETKGHSAGQLRQKIADLDIKCYKEQTIGSALHNTYKTKAEASSKGQLNIEMDKINTNELTEAKTIRILIHESRDTFWKWFFGTVLFGIIVGIVTGLILTNFSTNKAEKTITEVSYNINYTKLLDGRAVKS